MSKEGELQAKENCQKAMDGANGISNSSYINISLSNGEKENNNITTVF